MPSRRIILLLIAVLAMLGARSARGQSHAAVRLGSAAGQYSKASPPEAGAIRPTQPGSPLPYMQAPVRLSRAAFSGSPWTRRAAPRLTLSAADWLAGSAGLIWTQHQLLGTMEIRLLLF